ncbi:unnamed protein product [Paramecium octaurelia]|uniref:Uncharacterized protein n=1 Tax=Paramecium octaurelia TaxID=43137 RepID=A0A8S1WI57_PAROT|nr:unnamed protein product [Paramecium octaurelia]
MQFLDLPNYCFFQINKRIRKYNQKKSTKIEDLKVIKKYQPQIHLRYGIINEYDNPNQFASNDNQAKIIYIYQSSYMRISSLYNNRDLKLRNIRVLSRDNKLKDQSKKKRKNQTYTFQIQQSKKTELEKKITDLEQQLQQKDFYHKKDIDNLHLKEEKKIPLAVIEQPNETSDRNKSMPQQQQIKKGFKRLDSMISHKCYQFQFIYSKTVQGCLTLSDLIDTFKQYPFELSDEQTTLISRLIIEPQQEDWIYCDLNCRNYIVIAITFFKISLKPTNDEITLNESVSYLQLSGDHCSIQEFKKALGSIDILLSHKLDDLLMMKIY